MSEPDQSGLSFKALARLLRTPPDVLDGWRDLDIKTLGRVLWHAAIVGVAAGIIATLFYGALALCHWLLLGELAHLDLPRALGEVRVFPHASEGPTRQWLVFLLPGLGGLACGLLVHFFCRDAAGPGGDRFIAAFHQQRGQIPWRVPWVKGLASLVTIGTGGSVGREGPTMQIAAGVASGLARRLRLSDRERRILLVAGAAAATGAIFQTPLGAAIYGVELLYRDDFETDALVPSVLASVIAYSIFTTAYGQGHLLITAPSYPFKALSLPFYGLMAVGISVVGAVFVKVRHAAQDRVFGPMKWLPPWAKPALGGLMLGALALAVPQALGAGYGLVQGAIVQSDWLERGAWGALMLFGLAGIKVLATSLSLGSGGSGGEFGPTLVIGGLVGGAFGLLFHSAAPSLVPDPGAFALVGMGALIGGIAHVPLSSLIIVCELAGSYDLLVPLMLAEGITYVLLRRVYLYREQLVDRRASPAHRHESHDVLESVRVGEIVRRERLETIAPEEPLHTVIAKMSHSPHPALLVQREGAAPLGLVSLEALRGALEQEDLAGLAVAADVMVPLSPLTAEHDLHDALRAFVNASAQVLPVMDQDRRRVVGLITQDDVTSAYERAAAERTPVAAE